MADNDVTITIGGDSDPFVKALKDAEDGAKKLEDNLKQIALISGAAFAALTAEAVVALKAFEDSDSALRQLNQSLQNAGIYSQKTAEDYKGIASSLQNLTGVEDEVITKGQAVLQSFLGQTKQTEEMDKAVLNLAQGLGIDAAQAFELVGKSVGTNNNALARYGIELDSSLTKQEKINKILEISNARFGGMAEASMQGLGSVKGLKNAISDLQEEIGARLAPAVTSIVKGLTAMINWFSQNKIVLDFVVAIGAGAAAVTGMVAAVAAGALAFAKLQEIMILVNATTKALGLSVNGLAAATGIGLLIAAVALVYTNWETIWPAMQATFKAFVDNISPLLKGLGYLLAGALTFNVAMIKDGFNQVKESISKFVDDAANEYVRLDTAVINSAENQNATLKTMADQRQADQDARDAYTRESQKLHLEAMRLEREGHSQQLVELTNQESELLKTMADEKNAAVLEQERLQLEQLRLQRSAAIEQDRQERAAFDAEILAKNQAFNAMSTAEQQRFLQANRANLSASILTEKEIRQKAALEQAQQDIERRNKFLEDERKFGTAYATINQAMHSSVYQGSKQAFGELAQLQQSSSNELKEIGKVAAVANIIMKTAESAMNIYAGFSTIPIVGPVLGAAGAAAAIIFGGEQVRKVTAAQTGGLVEGGTPGVDSVPFMLEPGELVVPRQNFAEVINAVASAREIGGAGGGGSDGASRLVIGFDGDEAQQVLTLKQVEARYLGTIREAT